MLLFGIRPEFGQQIWRREWNASQKDRHWGSDVIKAEEEEEEDWSAGCQAARRQRLKSQHAFLSQKKIRRYYHTRPNLLICRPANSSCFPNSSLSQTQTLRGRRFETEELDRLRELLKKDFLDVFRNWILRCKKCIEFEARTGTRSSRTNDELVPRMDHLHGAFARIEPANLVQRHAILHGDVVGSVTTLHHVNGILVST